MARRNFTPIALAALLLLAIASHVRAGNGVYWHLDPSVETCSMQIDPSLTQSQWATFTRQGSAIISFKSLSSAEPLGKMNFTLGVDYSSTPIDQHDPAWINTFVHPDAGCPLGDQIEFPALRGRLGVTDNMDVGAYWTDAPGANYGFIGAEVKYAFLREKPRVPAMAAVTSASWLTGVPDFNFANYNVGVVVSKRIAMFTPYAGVRENLAVGTETTSKVNLETETIAYVQGVIGATYSFWHIGLAAEYNIADVNTLALVFGLQ